MDGIFSTIGLCSIVILISYIIKKGNECLKLKKEKQKSYKFDEDVDE